MRGTIGDRAEFGPHLKRVASAAIAIGGVALLLFAFGSGPALAGSTAAAVSHAPSAPPDLTGSWVNKAAPNSSPPWQLTASNGLQTLNANWTGGPGHTSLHGNFHGSLMTINGAFAYKGPFHITEGNVMVDGEGTFTIQTANQIKIDITPNSGSPSSYIFVRVGASAPTLASAPTPATFDAPVAVPAPSGGNAATDASPVLGNATSVTATEDGLTADDLAVIPFLIPGFRHTCYVNFFSGIFGHNVLKTEKGADGRYNTNYKLVIASLPKALSNLAACLAYVESLAQAAANAPVHGPNQSTAIVAGAACSGLKAGFKGNGKKTKVSHLAVHGLHVNCARTSSGLKITVSTGSGKPLHNLVGSRLHVLVLRGKHDPTGGQLTFSYHKG